MRMSFSEEELDRNRVMWSRPGAMTAMLNWYRNIFRSSRNPNRQQRITIPTEIIWGKRDKHLVWPMAEASLRFCENGRVVYFEDASHWVMQDKPEDVSRLLIAH